MGDRVVFHVFNGDRICPAVYGHWSGSAWSAVLGDLRKRMADRTDDPEYATARLVQDLIPEGDTGDTGFGVWNAPHANDLPKAWAAITSDDYSHGDAGIILIDCRDFKAFAHGGYAAREGGERSGLPAPPATWDEAVKRVK